VINSKRAVYFGREQQNLPEGMMEVDWSDVIAPLFSLISMLTVHFLPQPIPITALWVIPSLFGRPAARSKTDQ